MTRRSGILGIRPCGSRSRARRATGTAARKAQMPYKMLWFDPRAHLIIAFYSPSPACEASNHRRSGFRLAVHATDRAPAARAVGLLGNPAVQHADGRDPRAA